MAYFLAALTPHVLQLLQLVLQLILRIALILVVLLAFVLAELAPQTFLLCFAATPPHLPAPVTLMRAT